MVKYIFKQLLTRLSIIRKIVKVKILNRKKDLTMINFIWMLYTEFSKTTFYKIIFLGNKVLLILIAMFSFLTAYVEDLSWFNLALLASIIIAKLYSIYNIIMNKEETLNTDEFDPFIYASMALKSLSNNEEPIVNNDNDINTSIGLALIFLLFFGGLNFYQWDTDLTTTVKNISNAIFAFIKDKILARFTLRRDDDGNSSPGNSKKGKGREFYPENESERDYMGPGPSTTSHTIPTPPGPSGIVDCYNLSDEIEDLTEKSFNPFLLKQKTSYNTIKSILSNNNSKTEIPVFGSPEYNDLINTLDFKTSDFDIGFSQFEKMRQRIDLLSSSDSLAKKIIDNAIGFAKAPLDTPKPFNLDDDSTTDAKSEFGKKLKGMFNRPKQDPTTPASTTSKPKKWTITEDDSTVETPVLTKADIEKMAASRQALTDPNIFINRKLKPTTTDDRSSLYNFDTPKDTVNPMVANLRKVTQGDNSKPIFKTLNDEHSTISDPDIKTKMKKVRDANNNFNDNYGSDDNWSDGETPSYSRIRINPTDEIKIFSKEPYETYEDPSETPLTTSEKIRLRKERIRALLLEKQDSENQKLTIDSVAKPEDKDLTIEELILSNKNASIPKANPINDLRQMTKKLPLSNTLEETENEAIKHALNRGRIISEDYNLDKKEFKEMLGIRGANSEILPEGFSVYDTKAQAHYRLENGEFRLIMDGIQKSDSTMETITKEYKADLQKLLSNSKSGDNLIKPSDVRKQADLDDFYEE